MSIPYTLELRRGPDGRIVEKTETVRGRKSTWTYAYDGGGRLAEATLDGRLICQCWYDREGRRVRDYLPATAGANYRDYQYTPDNRLMRAGGGQYSHDERGFRSIWSDKGVYTLYEYVPDYRLLRAEEEDRDKAFTFAHDEDGQRVAKYLNGEPVEAYRWLDFVRLAAFYDGHHQYEFAYRDSERTPFAMRRDDGVVAGLFYDQVGSLRVVADMDDNVIKEVLYDPFGGIIEDTNPDLRLPLGFAGGLHDRDLGFVRFGWRDYDVRTGRWTAPDPIGEKGGDPDWYGYCLDDPVNGVDPLGLFVPLLIGLAGATGIAGIGATLAGLAADGLGALAGKNKEDPLKATKGAARGFAGAAAINSAMAAGAAGAAEAVEAAPAVISAAPTLIRQGRDAAKAAVSKGGEITKAGLDWARTNPDKIDKAARIGKDIVDPNLPPETPEGQLVTAGKFLAQEVNDRFEKGNDVANEQKKKSKHIPSGVWGR